jgi:hypothetical protein
MPKDEFDLNDPLELNGVGLATEEDTTDAMCACFIEEFMRMGFSAERILALFRNPQYVGMSLVWQQRGEPFIREAIAEAFARWGRSVSWPVASQPGTAGQDPGGEEHSPAPVNPSPHPLGKESGKGEPAASAQDKTIDPMGAPIPKFRV